MAGNADVNGRRVPLHRRAVTVECRGHTTAVRPRDGRGHGPPGRCRPSALLSAVPAPVAAAAAA